MSFIIVPTNPLPFSPEIPPPSSLVTVSLCSISVSLVLFFLFVCFVDYGPIKGEIIWYLSFTAWWKQVRGGEGWGFRLGLGEKAENYLNNNKI